MIDVAGVGIVLVSLAVLIWNTVSSYKAMRRKHKGE